MQNTIEDVHSIANEVLFAIQSSDAWEDIDIRIGDEAEGYYDELLDLLVKSGLNEEQQEIARALSDVHYSAVSDHVGAAIAYGIKAGAAMCELVRNPEAVLNYRRGRSTPAREMHRLHLGSACRAKSDDIEAGKHEAKNLESQPCLQVEMPECPQIHWFVADGIKYENVCFDPSFTNELH